MPELPAGCLPLWNVFCELSARRGSTGFGPAPLSWADLQGWQAVYGARLSPWEIDRIFEIDALWVTTVAESQANQNPPTPPT